MGQKILPLNRKLVKISFKKITKKFLVIHFTKYKYAKVKILKVEFCLFLFSDVVI